MEKISFNQQFAQRLREALLKAGFHSKRSPSGVDIHKLAQLTGYSVQICRKYLRGEALPEPTKLAEFAPSLGVSPGWLLFGDTQSPNMRHEIKLNKEVLHYLLSEARPLYQATRTSDEIADFLLDLVVSLSQIDTHEEQSKQIIDLALSSIKHLRT